MRLRLCRDRGLPSLYRETDETPDLDRGNRDDPLLLLLNKKKKFFILIYAQVPGA